MPITKKPYFANLFGVFEDPERDMVEGELAFNTDMRLIYKDMTGVLHLLPNIYDYKNIYDPETIQITQSQKNSSIGVGDEGDFSNKVTIALPHEMKVIATGINQRQAIVHYDKNDKVKDILLLPEYFCKLGPGADEFNVNKGVITEWVNKILIESQPERIPLTNNAIFKLVKLETSDIHTVPSRTITTEANKDNVDYRGQVYIGEDNYLYLIESIETDKIDLPMLIMNRRNNPIEVRTKTSYFLFEKGDKFSIQTVRAFMGNSTGSDHEFVREDENVEIVDILRSDKVSPLRTTSENLTISEDKKKVEGLDNDFYYEIVVSTNETRPHPIIVYEILDISDGFFNYLYRIIKYITNNIGGLGSGVISMGAFSRKYLFEYTYVATNDNTMEFTIPEEYFNPDNSDREMLSYRGINLERGTDYIIPQGTRTVKLNFPINKGDVVHGYIFKFAGNDEEASLISGLQNHINDIEAGVTKYKLSIEDYKTIIRMGGMA